MLLEKKPHAHFELHGDNATPNDLTRAFGLQRLVRMSQSRRNRVARRLHASLKTGVEDPGDSDWTDQEEPEEGDFVDSSVERRLGFEEVEALLNDSKKERARDKISRYVSRLHAPPSRRSRAARLVSRLLTTMQAVLHGSAAILAPGAAQELVDLFHNDSPNFQLRALLQNSTKLISKTKRGSMEQRVLVALLAQSFSCQDLREVLGESNRRQAATGRRDIACLTSRGALDMCVWFVSLFRSVLFDLIVAGHVATHPSCSSSSSPSSRLKTCR